VLTAIRRVTYDTQGTPIIRLNDNFPLTDGGTPVEEYKRKSLQNKKFFKEMKKAGSLNEKLKISQSLSNSLFRINKPNGSFIRVKSIDAAEQFPSSRP